MTNEELQRENNQLRKQLSLKAERVNRLEADKLELSTKLSDEQFARTEITRQYHDECAKLAQELRDERAKCERLEMERDETHESNKKLKSGWQRLGDQCKAGNGPTEFIRFNNACEKNKGDVVETMLSYLFSLWNDFDKSRSELTTTQARLSEAIKVVKISDARCTCGGQRTGRMHDDEHCPIGIRAKFLSAEPPATAT